MYVVYILVSQKNPSKHYVGFTQNLEARLKAHNNSKSGYTRQYAPWQIETHIIFRNEGLARKFERYLKVGSGSSFLRKRFLPSLA